MAGLSDQVKLALGRYWPEVYGGAAAGLSTQDLFANIRDRATDLGLFTPGVSASAISTLRGYAGRMLRAADALGNADPTLALDSSMISAPPWARSPAEQAAMPVYHVGFDHTIQGDDGEESVVRQTIIITGALPATVGDLNDLVATEAQLLAQESPGTSTASPHGTSVGVDNLALMVV
jgi:hypothetical protein